MNWIWITALVAIIGGFFMKILRDQQRYRLMRVALERGDGTLPGGMPIWAVSFRQGVKLASLGAALVAAGIFVWLVTPNVGIAHGDKVATALPAPPPPPPAHRPAKRKGASAAPARGSHRLSRPHRPLPPRIMRPGMMGPWHRGFGMHPRGPFGHGWPHPMMRGPPTPRMARAQMAANQRLAAVTSIAVGIVFGVLGLVRLALARWERRTLAQQTPAHGDDDIL